MDWLITTEGSTPQMIGTGWEGTTITHPSGDLCAPIFPDVKDLRVYNMPTECPMVFQPLGNLRLEVGQKVQIHSMDGSGEWCFAWVLKKLPNGHGCDWPWYRLGASHQLEMF